MEASAPPLSDSALARVTSLGKALHTELDSVLLGKSQFLTFLLCALFGGGHVLIQDIPGLGKTTVAKALAGLIQGKFRRIQGTPDLLPYDITGVEIFNPETRSFDFKPGPIFTHILLADELNRTTPKVQSALLEAMAEGQVTIGLKTHPLPEPFFVIATQNTVDVEGTYPLPLAQADRFMMQLSIGYPEPDAELEVYRRDPGAAVPTLHPVCTVDDLLEVRQTVAQVYGDPKILRMIQQILLATRSHLGIQLGASPRAGLMLLKAARALAALSGRSFITDEDIVALAPSVLAHRLRVRDIRLDPAEFIGETALHIMKDAIP
ncbi:MAG: AAA family ATPase [Spirochaetes bacterium]|nr:AAA family ATPase [Spirochaetota bacterium]